MASRLNGVSRALGAPSLAPDLARSGTLCGSGEDEERGGRSLISRGGGHSSAEANVSMFSFVSLSI